MLYSYRSGRVAVCVSRVNDYHRRYYAYAGEDHRPPIQLSSRFDQKNAAVLRGRTCGRQDECSSSYAEVGSAASEEGDQIILSKTGGLVSNAKGDITQVGATQKACQCSELEMEDPADSKLDARAECGLDL